MQDRDELSCEAANRSGAATFVGYDLQRKVVIIDLQHRRVTVEQVTSDEDDEMTLTATSAR